MLALFQQDSHGVEPLAIGDPADDPFDQGLTAELAFQLRIDPRGRDEYE